MAQSSRGGSSVWVLPSCIFLKIKVLCGHSCGENGALVRLVRFFLLSGYKFKCVRDKAGDTVSMSYFELCHRPCKLCQRGSTLAVLGPNRTKVRLFNTNTDEMVGEIETALGECQEMGRGMVVLHLAKTFFQMFPHALYFFLLEIYTD